MMGSRCTLVGVEVPIIGSDSVKWTELSLPPSSTAIAISDSDTNVSVPSICSPLSDDFASCSAIGDPPIYVTCCVICYTRIKKSLPNALELLADKEFPRIGLQITFPDALSASAFVCKNEEADVLTKGLNSVTFQDLISKQGMDDTYSSA